MQRTEQTRRIYKQTDLRCTLAIPTDFTDRGGQLHGWLPTLKTVTGTWRQPGMLPVEPED